MEHKAESLINALIKETPLLWDGGMGTMLIAAGMKTGEVPEIWNVDHADKIRDIHKEYFSAGARAVQSNTFGGHPMKLKSYDLQDRARELNLEGVKRVLEAAPPGYFIIGDIGPSGAMLPPTGDADPDEVFDGFRLQAWALADGGAEALHIETMFDLGEMKLAVKAAVETGLPVMASMTYQPSKRGMFTIMGVSPEEAVKTLQDMGVVAVGANCTIGPKEMVGLVAEMKKHAEVPIIAQPNAGTPKVDGDKTVYDMTAAEFASYTLPMIEAGASIVGGCCGTNPEFIREMAKQMEKA